MHKQVNTVNQTNLRDPQIRGRFKMGVFFTNHTEGNPAKYFYSNIHQDKKPDNLIKRFENMVNDRWHGRVNTAMIYDNGTIIKKFCIKEGQWVIT